MEVYHVVAMANHRVIGKHNKLPWHFSSDMKHFKELTLGSTVIMGRKTFESLGKPLPGRENFVMTRAPQTDTEHLRFFDSVEKAIRSVTTSKAFIIGGAQIFQQTLSQIKGIYLTQIEGDYEGDAFYPEIPSFFKEGSRKTLQENPKIEVIFYENLQKR